MSANERYENFSITMLPTDIQLMDLICKDRGISRSELLRQGLKLFYEQYKKSFVNIPDCGIYIDASGQQVHVGILSEQYKAKVESGEWKKIKDF